MTHSHPGDDARIRRRSDTGFPSGKEAASVTDQASAPVRQAPAASGVAAGATRTGPAKINRRVFEAMWFDPTVTTDEIAARFGLYRTSVTPLGYRLGLPPRKTGAKPKVCRDTFCALWLAHVSTAEIARHLGISRNYTGVLARRFGLGNRPQGMRGTISMADYRVLQLREALAARAREEQAALRMAEMVDGRRDPRNTGKRAA